MSDTCARCSAPDAPHAVLDADGSRRLCALCLIALIGACDHALTLMADPATAEGAR